MLNEGLVTGFETTGVDAKMNWWVRLKPRFFSPPLHSPSHMRLREPFVKKGDAPFVYGWTEHALQEMDRLGMGFLSELHGPVLLRSWANERVEVPVWVSPTYTPGDGAVIAESAVQLVDAWMAGEVGPLSSDDLEFLAFNYPSSRKDVSVEYSAVVLQHLRPYFRRPEMGKVAAAVHDAAMLTRSVEVVSV